MNVDNIEKEKVIKETDTDTVKKQRQEGIELLRILLMFGIVVLHILLFSGLLNYRTMENQTTKIFFFMYSFFIVAVNCYVLISGYFLVESKFKPKKIIELIIQVATYSWLIMLIILLLERHLDTWDILLCVFPTILKTYWFATCYIVLYLISPFLNMGLKNLDQKYLKFIIIFLTLTSWLSSVLSASGFDCMDITKRIWNYLVC